MTLEGTPRIVTLPLRWRGWADPDTGVLAAARAPYAGADGVVPTLRLVVRRAGDPWPEPSGGILDVEHEAVVDTPAGTARFQRVAHRHAGVELVSDRWRWEEGAVGYVLTGTAARADYAESSAVFASVAATFAPDVRAARSATAYSSVRAS